MASWNGGEDVHFNSWACGGLCRYAATVGAAGKRTVYATRARHLLQRRLSGSHWGSGSSCGSGSRRD